MKQMEDLFFDTMTALKCMEGTQKYIYDAKMLQCLIKRIEAFKVESWFTPEYHIKNALLAALTGKDHMVVISYLADAYKYALQKEYYRMQNDLINQ